MPDAIFVIGMQRSGTTIVSRLLSAADDVSGAALGFHPYPLWDIAGSVELAVFSKSSTPLLAKMDEYLKKGDGKYRLVKLALPACWEAMYWPVLLRKYPNAKIVLTTRNSRDQFCSWSKLEYLDGRHNESLYHEFWRYYTTQIKELAARDDRVLIHDYDDMVQRPQDSLGKVESFLGISGLDASQIRQPQNWSVAG